LLAVTLSDRPSSWSPLAVPAGYLALLIPQCLINPLLLVLALLCKCTLQQYNVPAAPALKNCLSEETHQETMLNRPLLIQKHPTA